MILLATLSAFGLEAVILTSSTLFALVKILGCAYLVYLEVKAWRSPCTVESIRHQNSLKSTVAFPSVFKEGFGVGISNPKAIAFFTALFLHFIDVSRPFVPQYLTLILTIEGISFVVLMEYALLSSLVSPLLSTEKAMSMFNKLTGVAFIGFGISLMYAR